MYFSRSPRTFFPIFGLIETHRRASIRRKKKRKKTSNRIRASTVSVRTRNIPSCSGERWWNFFFHKFTESFTFGTSGWKLVVVFRCYFAHEGKCSVNVDPARMRISKPLCYGSVMYADSTFSSS